MPLIFSDNPQPIVGQLFYMEYVSENGAFQSASLDFIDEDIEPGKQWMYTEIALMEDFGNDLEVYTGIEAGGMPPKYTRLATDEDILKFLKLIKAEKISDGSKVLEKWIEEIMDDRVLLPEEKERLQLLSRLV